MTFYRRGIPNSHTGFGSLTLNNYNNNISNARVKNTSTIMHLGSFSLENSKTSINTYDFIFLYTFDYPVYFEHLKMLVLSIISVIREFINYKIHIFIYSTTVEKIKEELNCLHLENFITIRLYDPKKYNHQGFQFNKDKKHYNYIGHSRIFIVKELLVEMNCPVIYMDNDTGIQVNCGCYCYQIIKKATLPIPYTIENWITFEKLFIQEGDYLNIKNFENENKEINSAIHPFNNGIIIFPYNEYVINFLEDVKKNYIKLAKSFPSIYHDMFAFSITCYKFGIKEELTNFINKNNKPNFIHYYLNKYDYMEIIKECSTKIINLFLQKKQCILYDSNLHNESHLVSYLVCNKNDKQSPQNFLFTFSQFNQK
jgi:hypothetical protein